jgi:hypothetical protein
MAPRKEPTSILLAGKTWKNSDKNHIAKHAPSTETIDTSRSALVERSVWVRSIAFYRIETDDRLRFKAARLSKIVAFCCLSGRLSAFPNRHPECDE